MKKAFENPVVTIAFFEFRENIRNKWLLVYGLSFLLFSALITYMGASDPLQASGSLLNLMLLLVPLFSLVFGSISFSESLPFSEVLVAQPISRRQIFLGKWLGLGAGLSLSFLLGMGLGSLIQMNLAQKGFGSYFFLLFLGILLTFVFLSISFHMVNVARKRELIFGLVLVNWFFFFVLYDLIVMGVALAFGDYPLEIPMLIFVFLNPIDLARVLLLMQIDLSALMGYSGALFEKYLGATHGMIAGSLALVLWVLLPAVLGLRSFRKKDL
ncbi:MAG: ABC transporter permease subunit [bacterium]